jgi:hypothetical protein
MRMVGRISVTPSKEMISFATSSNNCLMMSMVLSLRCNNASRTHLGRSNVANSDDLSAYVREQRGVAELSPARLEKAAIGNPAPDS